MAGLGLVSPGIKVKEVDLTRGGITGVSDQTGAIAGPFVKGAVEDPQLIESEKDLVDTFGEPQETSGQYEYCYQLHHIFHMVAFLERCVWMVML